MLDRQGKHNKEQKPLAALGMRRGHSTAKHICRPGHAGEVGAVAKVAEHSSQAAMAGKFLEHTTPQLDRVQERLGPGLLGTGARGCVRHPADGTRRRRRGRACPRPHAPAAVPVAGPGAVHVRMPRSVVFLLRNSSRFGRATPPPYLHHARRLRVPRQHPSLGAAGAAGNGRKCLCRFSAERQTYRKTPTFLARSDAI